MIAILAMAFVVDTLVIDSFDSVSGWSTNPSEGVEFSIHSDQGLHGRGMRIDFDFHGHQGYGIARRAVKLELPPNYEFLFALRGNSPTNTLEFKLIEPNNQTVWWSRTRQFDFPSEWRTLVRTQPQICYAWGPSPDIGAQLRNVARTVTRRKKLDGTR